MALEDDKQATPLVPKAVPSPKEDVRIVSQTNSSHPLRQDSSPSSKPLTPKQFILSVARNLSAQPLQNSDPGVWGVLTAISNNARKRQQGINILLTADEHCIGRLVDDTRFQIESSSVSANHCTIYRKMIATQDVEQPSSFCISVLLKDTSTNGTFINWERLKKNSSEAKVQHGDIISFAAPPQHELAFAYVYREVLKVAPLKDGAVLKRKAEELGSENKKQKGIGIGAPEGPISLDDFRSLQRSNTDLRKQLESQVLMIDRMRNESRLAIDRHENEMKELKGAVSQSFLDQIENLCHSLEVSRKDLVEANKISAERQNIIEDLTERLGAAMQSRTDADEIINSQKGLLSEIEARLNEERNQRKEEREKAAADLNAALQRVQSEAQDELKRRSDIALRRQSELQENINKLQESDRERSLLLETLRSKLEDTRQKLVISEEKVRQLEAEIRKEQLASTNARKKAEDLEHDAKRLRKELECEKAAREEAWAKFSALELEMNAAMRDLSVEKQRFQDATERIMLRETQLRAFYSTTGEISALCARQLEQLRIMQRTLEDEENHGNTSVDIDFHATKGKTNGTAIREKEPAAGSEKEGSASSTPRVVGNQADGMTDEASDTEKNECNIRSQEDHNTQEADCDECNIRSQEGHNTQEADCTSANHSVKGGGFGSDIDGVGTAPVLEEDHIETERVVGTESSAMDFKFGDQNVDLNKCITLTGDTMQLDEAQIQENGEQNQRVYGESACHSQSNQHAVSKGMEDAEAGCTIKTADLLASEPIGSWAVSTAPSVHGENESPRSGENDCVRSDGEGAAAPHCSNGLVAESQTITSAVAAATALSQMHQQVNGKINIVAPDDEQFGGISYGGYQGRGHGGSTSDSDTKEGSNHDSDDNGLASEGGCSSDAETEEGSDGGDKVNELNNDAMDNDDTQEDSLG